MHRKRVTFELHDSYFRLMTIKHSISKIQWAIVWALNHYLTQLNSRQLETRCCREGHTRPGGSRKPPIEWALGLWLNNRRIRKTQRDGHNSGVKIWSLCSVSSTLSHVNLEQPFRTLAIKWEVIIIVKKSSCIFVFRRFFLRPSLLRLLSLRRYVSSIYIYMYATLLG